MSKKYLSKQSGRRVVIVGEDLGMLDKLVASHANSSTDHVDILSFSQPDTNPSLQPLPARSTKTIMSVQLNPPNSLGFRSMLRWPIFLRNLICFSRAAHNSCQAVFDYYKQQCPASSFQGQDYCSQGLFRNCDIASVKSFSCSFTACGRTLVVLNLERALMSPVSNDIFLRNTVQKLTYSLDISDAPGTQGGTSSEHKMQGQVPYPKHSYYTR